MIQALLLSGVMGLIFVIALTVAIPDIDETLAAAAPASRSMAAQLGLGLETLLLLLAAVSIIACGLVVMTRGGRLVYNMSRDRQFPAHQVFSKLAPRHRVPIVGTALMSSGA